MTNLRKWKKLIHVPGFPTSTVKPKSYGDKTQMSFVREACIAFFPTWSLNYSRHMYALRTFFFSSATLFAPNHVTRNEWSWHMPWSYFGHVCPWFGLYGDKMVPNWEHNLYQTILINDNKGHICMAKWSQDLSKLKGGKLTNENGTLTRKSYKLLMTTVLMMWCWWLILAVISKSFAT